MSAYSGLSYSVNSGSVTLLAGGRSFVVDDSSYLNANLDVKAAVAAGAFSSGFEHWLAFGYAEGRSIPITSPVVNGSFTNFVESAYDEAYPDIAAALTNGLESGFRHFLEHGANELRATHGYLTQQGSAGNDTLTMGAARVYGYEGNDSIASGGTAFGGTGNDTIAGGDIIYGNQDSDTLSGASTMYGGKGGDLVTGTMGGNMIYGNMDDNLLYGGYVYLGHGAAASGNDYIHGGHGNDTIYGQGHNDTLYGGLGADQFRFDGETAMGVDGLQPIGATTIRDFAADQGDHIVLGGSGRPTNFAEVQANATDGTSGVVIDISVGGSDGGATLTLTGIAKDQLQADWFVFT